jgi:hypothetical protein
MDHVIRVTGLIPGLLYAILLIAPAGCSRGDRPELGRVRGTIYLDEQPLDGAIIYFSPEGGGRVSQDMTDAQGKFDAVYIGRDRGAKVGKHKVRITTAYETVDEKTGRTIEKKEVIPKRYNSEQTELSVEVKPGDNILDFKLESKP